MSKSRREVKKDQNSLSPENYKQLLSKIELLDISQIKSDTFFLWEKVFVENKSLKNAKINITNSYNFKTVKIYYVATVQWALKAKFDEDKDNFLVINAAYNVLLSKSADVPKEFWNIYKKATLPLIIFPYFREFVQSVSSRMNIPPLTLPILFR